LPLETIKQLIALARVVGMGPTSYNRSEAYQASAPAPNRDSGAAGCPRTGLLKEPLPNKSTRESLGRQLNLSPRQVWIECDTNADSNPARV